MRCEFLLLETHTNTLCSRQFKTINTMISSFQRTKSHPLGCLRVIPSKLNKVSCVQVSVRLSVCFLRKEVIQPQVLLRLPCYDFTLIICPTLDGSLPKRVTPPASGVTNSHGVTGGVYKARERIHRGVLIRDY